MPEDSLSLGADINSMQGTSALDPNLQLGITSETIDVAPPVSPADKIENPDFQEIVRYGMTRGYDPLDIAAAARTAYSEIEQEVLQYPGKQESERQQALTKLSTEFNDTLGKLGAWSAQESFNKNFTLDQQRLIATKADDAEAEASIPGYAEWKKNTGTFLKNDLFGRSAVRRGGTIQNQDGTNLADYDVIPDLLDNKAQVFVTIPQYEKQDAGLLDASNPAGFAITEGIIPAIKGALGMVSTPPKQVGKVTKRLEIPYPSQQEVDAEIAAAEKGLADADAQLKYQEDYANAQLAMGGETGVVMTSPASTLAAKQDAQNKLLKLRGPRGREALLEERIAAQMKTPELSALLPENFRNQIQSSFLSARAGLASAGDAIGLPWMKGEAQGALEVQDMQAEVPGMERTAFNDTAMGNVELGAIGQLPQTALVLGTGGGFGAASRALQMGFGFAPLVAGQKNMEITGGIQTLEARAEQAKAQGDLKMAESLMQEAKRMEETRYANIAMSLATEIGTEFLVPGEALAARALAGQRYTKNQLLANVLGEGLEEIPSGILGDAVAPMFGSADYNDPLSIENLVMSPAVAAVSTAPVAAAAAIIKRDGSNQYEIADPSIKQQVEALGLPASFDTKQQAEQAAVKINSDTFNASIDKALAHLPQEQRDASKQIAATMLLNAAQGDVALADQFMGRIVFAEPETVADESIDAATQNLEAAISNEEVQVPEQEVATQEAEAPTQEPVIQEVEVDAIVPIPEDLQRAKQDQAENNERWQQASASEEEILLLPIEGGRYQIVDGHHRYLRDLERGVKPKARILEPNTQTSPSQGAQAPERPAGRGLGALFPSLKSTPLQQADQAIATIDAGVLTEGAQRNRSMIEKAANQLASMQAAKVATPIQEVVKPADPLAPMRKEGRNLDKLPEATKQDLAAALQGDEAAFMRLGTVQRAMVRDAVPKGSEASRKLGLRQERSMTDAELQAAATEAGYNPEPEYHFTNRDFNKFRGDIVFTTPDKTWAKKFGGRELKLFNNAPKNLTFDDSNAKHLQDLELKLVENGTDEAAAAKLVDKIRDPGNNNSWVQVEQAPVQQAIKNMGFVAFTTKEEGRQITGFYQPDVSLKLATDTGVPSDQRFDPENPDIRYQTSQERDTGPSGSITPTAPIGETETPQGLVFTAAKVLIDLSKTSDATTLMHEMIHAMRFLSHDGRTLLESAMGTENFGNLMRWGTKQGTLSPKDEETDERLAEGFEVWLATSVLPDDAAQPSALRRAFEALQRVIRDIVSSLIQADRFRFLKGEDTKLPADVAAAYQALLSRVSNEVTDSAPTPTEQQVRGAIIRGMRIRAIEDLRGLEGTPSVLMQTRAADVAPAMMSLASAEYYDLANQFPGQNIPFETWKDNFNASAKVADITIQDDRVMRRLFEQVKGVADTREQVIFGEDSALVADLTTKELMPIIKKDVLKQLKEFEKTGFDGVAIQKMRQKVEDATTKNQLDKALNGITRLAESIAGQQFVAATAKFKQLVAAFGDGKKASMADMKAIAAEYKATIEDQLGGTDSTIAKKLVKAGADGLAYSIKKGRVSPDAVSGAVAAAISLQNAIKLQARRAFDKGAVEGANVRQAKAEAIVKLIKERAPESSDRYTPSEVASLVDAVLKSKTDKQLQKAIERANKLFASAEQKQARRDARAAQARIKTNINKGVFDVLTDSILAFATTNVTDIPDFLLPGYVTLAQYLGQDAKTIRMNGVGNQVASWMNQFGTHQDTVVADDASKLAQYGPTMKRVAASGINLMRDDMFIAAASARDTGVMRKLTLPQKAKLATEQAASARNTIMARMAVIDSLDYDALSTLVDDINSFNSGEASSAGLKEQMDNARQRRDAEKRASLLRELPEILKSMDGNKFKEAQIEAGVSRAAAESGFTQAWDKMYLFRLPQLDASTLDEWLTTSELQTLANWAGNFNQGIVAPQLLRIAGKIQSMIYYVEKLDPVMKKFIRKQLVISSPVDDPNSLVQESDQSSIVGWAMSNWLTAYLFPPALAYGGKEGATKMLKERNENGTDMGMRSNGDWARATGDIFGKTQRTSVSEADKYISTLEQDLKALEDEKNINGTFLNAASKRGLLNHGIWGEPLYGIITYFAGDKGATNRATRGLLLNHVLGLAAQQAQLEANAEGFNIVDDYAGNWIPRDMGAETPPRKAFDRDREIARAIIEVTGPNPTSKQIYSLAQNGVGERLLKNWNAISDVLAPVVRYTNAYDEVTQLPIFKNYFPRIRLNFQQPDLVKQVMQSFTGVSNQTPSSRADAREARTAKYKIGDVLDMNFGRIARNHIREVTADANFTPTLKVMNDGWKILNQVSKSGNTERGGVYGALGDQIVAASREAAGQFAASYYSVSVASNEVRKGLMEYISQLPYALSLDTVTRAFTEQFAGMFGDAIYDPETIATYRETVRRKKEVVALMQQLGAQSLKTAGSLQQETEYMQGVDTSEGLARTIFDEAHRPVPLSPGFWGLRETNPLSRMFKAWQAWNVQNGEKSRSKGLWLYGFRKSFKAATGQDFEWDKLQSYDPEIMQRASFDGDQFVAQRSIHPTKGGNLPPSRMVKMLEGRQSTASRVYNALFYSFTSYSAGQKEYFLQSLHDLAFQKNAHFDRTEATKNIAAFMASSAVLQMSMTGVLVTLKAALGDKEDEQRRDEFFGSITGQRGIATFFREWGGLVARGTFAGIFGSKALWQRLGIASMLEYLNAQYGNKAGFYDGQYAPYEDRVLFEAPPDLVNAMVSLTNPERIAGSGKTFGDVKWTDMVLGIGGLVLQHGEQMRTAAFTDELQKEPELSFSYLLNSAMYLAGGFQIPARDVESFIGSAKSRGSDAAIERQGNRLALKLASKAEELAAAEVRNDQAAINSLQEDKAKLLAAMQKNIGDYQADLGEPRPPEGSIPEKWVQQWEVPLQEARALEEVSKRYPWIKTPLLEIKRFKNMSNKGHGAEGMKKVLDKLTPEQRTIILDQAIILTKGGKIPSGDDAIKWGLDILPLNGLESDFGTTLMGVTKDRPENDPRYDPNNVDYWHMIYNQQGGDAYLAK